MRENKLLEKIKHFCNNHKIESVIIGIFIITIALPYIINKLLYIDIATHDSTDGDWLGFWGSFLGGILGGMATLVGVIYTIKKGDKDKQIEEVRNLPFIVPFQQSILVYRDVKNQSCNLSNEGKDTNQFEYEMIYFDLINLGQQHAFNISIEWNPPELQQINKFLEYNKIKNQFDNGFKLICSSKKEERKNEIQIIKSSNNEDIKRTYIFVGWRQLIHNIVECIARENNGSKNDKIYNDMPLGQLEFKYKNIHGINISKRYLILAEIFQGRLEENLESYYLTFKFELEEDN